MEKKVRFNDEIQTNQMSMNLSDHANEVKLATDIIIDPDKVFSSPEEPRIDNTNDKQRYKWWLGLIVLIFIILVFLIWKYYIKG
jgi:nitric oxide reductase large subunit